MSINFHQPSLQNRQRSTSLASIIGLTLELLDLGTRANQMAVLTDLASINLLNDFFKPLKLVTITASHKTRLYKILAGGLLLIADNIYSKVTIFSKFSSSCQINPHPTFCCPFGEFVETKGHKQI